MGKIPPALAAGIAVLILLMGSWLHYTRGAYSYTAANGGFSHISGMDDAYISFRYGWNLLHFGTLSWNESGFRRTEGFTNPLWVYTSALWATLNDKGLVYPGMVLTSTLLTGGFLAILCMLTAKTTKSAAGMMGVVLLCASPLLWLHATSGLESTVFGCAIGLLAFSLIVDDTAGKMAFWLTNLLAFLLMLLRSDAFVYMLVLAAALALGKPRSLGMIAIGAVLGYVLVQVWREVSFGQFWPNTVDAKLNFDLAPRLTTGALLFTQSMWGGGVVFLVLGAFGLWLLPEAKRLAGAVTIFGWCAYYVFIGGDLLLERHLIGVMALCAGLSAPFFVRVLAERRGWPLLILLAAGLYLPFYIQDPRFQYEATRPRDSWVLIGKEMASQRDLYGTVVTFGAGKIPFFAGGDFVDELGLNDPELAQVQRPRFIPGHSAGNDQVALEIARRSSARYSYVAFNLNLTRENAGDVLLWASNTSPRAMVSHGLTASDRDVLLSAPPFDYTLIFRGN